MRENISRIRENRRCKLKLTAIVLLSVASLHALKRISIKHAQCALMNESESTHTVSNFTHTKDKRALSLRWCLSRAQKKHVRAFLGEYNESIQFDCFTVDAVHRIEYKMPYSVRQHSLQVISFQNNVQGMHSIQCALLLGLLAIGKKIDEVQLTNFI